MSELLLKSPIEDMSVLEVEINLSLKLVEIFEKYGVILSKEGTQYRRQDGKLFYKDKLLINAGSDKRLLAILTDNSCVGTIHDKHNELMQVISTLR